MSIAETCVYTIVHSDQIKRMVQGIEAPLIIHQKCWRTAKENFEKAQDSNQDFYCVIAPADNTTYLMAYGIVEDIIIDDDKNQTCCILSSIEFFMDQKTKKNSLIVTSTNTNLSSDYLRSYAICYTKNLIKKFEGGSSVVLSKTSAPAKNVSTVTQFKRSARVKYNVLLRANGKCELCKKNAPFLKEDDIPYFEIHHLIQLSEGGLDNEQNAVCLCPNCHRELHYGKESKKKTNILLEKIKI